MSPLATSEIGEITLFQLTQRQPVDRKRPICTHTEHLHVGRDAPSGDRCRFRRSTGRVSCFVGRKWSGLRRTGCWSAASASDVLLAISESNTSGTSLALPFRACALTRFPFLRARLPHVLTAHHTNIPFQYCTCFNTFTRHQI